MPAPLDGSMRSMAHCLRMVSLLGFFGITFPLRKSLQA